MAPEQSRSSGGGMLSLYANIPDPEEKNSTAPGTISRAPIVFKQSPETDPQQDNATEKQQQIAPASLRFQPVKRPQLSNQKSKSTPGIPKPVFNANSASPSDNTNAAGARAPVKTTLADWAAADDDDVNGFYANKPQRGGRKKRKKNRDAQAVVINWDDIYDPSRPNIYDEYKHSDEKIREIREWKDRLYAHRMARQHSSDQDSDEEYSRPARQFAPPQSYNFAPPPDLNERSRSPEAATPPEEALPNEPAYEPPPPPPAEVPNDATGEDAYARRLRMTAAQSQGPIDHQPQPPPPPSSTYFPPPPPPAPPAPSAPPLSAFQPPSATISRAPVRYSLPPAPEDIPATEEELEKALADDRPVESDENAPRSSRPGQKGFAERFMAKYGWTKGSGLGADGSGITKALQVKVEKQKKKPDSEGGGFATPAGRGKIIAETRKTEEGKFGAISEVIVLHGMLEGLDLDAEMESGNLVQEIGEECNEKYGRVERVFIHRECNGPVPVFVRFTNQLSALRAVNALEGRVFNGNSIKARFFDAEKFEQGIYE